MTTCAELKNTLGVYVLGAIDPTERGRLETHLASCPACRDELAGLAGMPALLGRVEEGQIDQLAGPPDELLDSLLARAASERRRGSFGRVLGGRGLSWTPLAAAASVVLLAGALVGGMLLGGKNDEAKPPPPQAAPTVTVYPKPPIDSKPEALRVSSPDGKVEAEMMLTKKKWGTAVELYLSGAPYGARCRLYAVARDGQRDMLGSWAVAYRHGYGEYEGSTMFQRSQIFSFEVVTVEGQPLITIPA
ncbi:zf-HC2 domain-containing protein [Actinomadura barringtoniae]|uniref:Zf-HC2 domain-containing protein n=1 Tax=Actinomadura barringtoniae TaxID=1427535 RepID=A0A939PT38_9ACTN|nr:zf-HC2 domain-containing protein [Actinomadura barringtoniae]MBO2454291.1 zf-HC2 domain-containing protein [Actinomadura barringtoniae]